MADAVVIAMIFAGLAGVVFYRRRLKKRGGSACGCGCAGCPSASLCGGKKGDIISERGE